MALDRHRRRRLWPPAEGNGAAVDDLAPVTGWEIARARFQSGRPLPRPMGSGAPKARPSPVAPARSATGAGDREAAGQRVAKPERPPRFSRQAVASPGGRRARREAVAGPSRRSAAREAAEAFRPAPTSSGGHDADHGAASQAFSLARM